MAIQLIEFCDGTGNYQVEYDTINHRIVDGQKSFDGGCDESVIQGDIIYTDNSPADGRYEVKALPDLFPYAYVDRIIVDKCLARVISAVNTQKESAPGENDGQITIQQFVPITAKFRITPLSDPGGWGVWQSSSVFNGLSAQYYYVQAQDPAKADCVSAAVAIQVKRYAALSVEYTVENSSAPGADDGMINLSPSNGSGSYSFAWADGPTVQNRTDLPPGAYSVVVTDDVTGLTSSINNITISEPVPNPPPAPFFEVPIMNSLRFIQAQVRDFCSSFDTPDNTLFCEQFISGSFRKRYLQKVMKCDTLPIQFNSNLEAHRVEVLDYDENENIVANFPAELKESNTNIIETVPILLQSHESGIKTRIYFGAGQFPFPINLGDAIEVKNNADGMDGIYSITSINEDLSLGVPYVVINIPYSGAGSSSSADGEFVYSQLDFNVYEAVVDLSSLENGEYYLRIIAENAEDHYEAISEPILLKDSFEDQYLMMIEYRNYSNGFGMTYNTGILNRIRLEARMLKPATSAERTNVRNYDFSITKASAYKKRRWLFETFHLPPWLHEKLSVIFDHDLIRINGVEYQTEEDYPEAAYNQALLGNASFIIEQVGWFKIHNTDDLGPVDNIEQGYILANEGYIKR